MYVRMHVCMMYVYVYVRMYVCYYVCMAGCPPHVFWTLWYDMSERRKGYLT